MHGAAGRDSSLDLRTRLTAALANRYSIERELGRGGMSIVYLAADLKHGRQVALKALRPEVSSGLGVDRFLREISSAAALAHPTIVPLYDSGTADGLLYFVMPVMEGESLRQRLERSRQLPIADAVLIARDISMALDYAHRRGIIHRDIKPDNILMHEGHAVVADFGVGRAIRAAAKHDEVTLGGLVVGTPGYMSPEQSAGADEIDGRSDLYSLGCVMFEMLTGEVPFKGTTRQMVVAQRFGAAPPPVVQLRPEIPIGLSRIVGKLLARDPTDRYPTGAAVAERLQDPQGEVRWEPERSIAVLPFTNMSADPEAEYFSDGITEDIINALTRFKGLRVTPRTSSFAFKGQHADLRTIADTLGVTSLLEGSVRKAGSRIRVTAQLVDAREGSHVWSARYDRELVDVFAIQDEIAQGIASRLEATFAGEAPASAERPLGDRVAAYDLYLKGRYHWNQRGEGLLRGLEYFQKAAALDPTLAQAHAGIADAFNLLVLYSLVSPLEAVPAAREAAARAIALDPSMAEAHSAIGWINMVFDWNWEGAKNAFERALDLNPTYVPARLWYAALRGFDYRAWDESIEIAQSGLDLDPASVFPRVHLAVLLIGARRYEAALPLLEAAMEREPDSFLAHRYLSAALRLTGHAKRALEVAEREVMITNRHPWSIADVALCLATLGDKQRATHYLNELIAARDTRYVQPMMIVTVTALLGRLDDALGWFAIAAQEHDPLIFAQAWPDLDPIRSDRFDQILTGAGFRLPAKRKAGGGARQGGSRGGQGADRAPGPLTAPTPES